MLHLGLPLRAIERLQRLKEETEAASCAGANRNALRVYEALAEEHEKGASFLLKRADGETAIYKIFA